MSEARLWLIRHAPVAGPKGVIHDSDAPADLSNRAAIDALRNALPGDAQCVASPSRRTMETAQALGLQPIAEPAFREQHFGAWTGRRHDDIARELERTAAACRAVGIERFHLIADPHRFGQAFGSPCDANAHLVRIVSLRQPLAVQ